MSAANRESKARSAVAKALAVLTSLGIGFTFRYATEPETKPTITLSAPAEPTAVLDPVYVYTQTSQPAPVYGNEPDTVMILKFPRDGHTETVSLKPKVVITFDRIDADLLMGLSLHAKTVVSEMQTRLTQAGETRYPSSGSRVVTTKRSFPLIRPDEGRTGDKVLALGGLK